MATTLSNFAFETQVPATVANIITSLSSEKKFIGSLSLTNTSASNVEVTLWLILTDTTATSGSGGNWKWKGTVPAGRSISVSTMLGNVVDKSMALKAQASTGNVVNIDISGTTE